MNIFRVNYAARWSSGQLRGRLADTQGNFGISGRLTRADSQFLGGGIPGTYREAPRNLDSNILS